MADRQVFRCPHCGKTFAKKGNMQAHVRTVCTPKQHGGAYRRGALRTFTRQDGIIESQSAYNNTLNTFEIVNNTDICALPEYLEYNKAKLGELITDQLNRKLCIKVNFQLDCLFMKMDGSMHDFNLSTPNEAVYMHSDLDTLLTETFASLCAKKEECALKNSGWSLHAIGSIKMRVSKYKPLRGSSYLSLPPEIEKKKACINPQNYDDSKCAMWAILADFTDNHPGRVGNLECYISKFNWSGMEFPTPVKDFYKFEKNNPNVSINVFALTEENTVFPVKVTDEEKEIHRDLLLIQSDGKSHYVLIKSFSRLVRSQLTKHRLTAFICKRCFNFKASQEQLDVHKSDCKRHKLAQIKMPQNDQEGNPPQVKFEHHQYQQDVPIVIYADFESRIVKIEGAESDPDKPATVKYSEHQPMSFGMYVKSRLPPGAEGDIPLGYSSYSGEDAARVFVERVCAVADKISKVYEKNVPIEMSSQEDVSHDQAVKCYICHQTFTAENHKVADHCHITGRYRGPACNQCNLLHRNPNFVPVFLHNLSGYDSHFIVRELDCVFGDITVIPQSSEKFISFSKILPTTVTVEKNGKKKKIVKNFHVRFLDSFRFMASSLDSLAKNLPRDKFVHVKENIPSHLVDLAVRKGVFCYEYVDSMQKLSVESLPPKSEFYSKLTESEISDEDYAHAQEVWRAFGIKNLGEYSDLYLKIDVLLLVDIFESFRDMCLATYKLDCCWYYTVPGLAWDAALRITGVKLDLITEEDMLLMVEKGIRGGLTQCSKRFAEADNKYTRPPGSVIQPTRPRFLMYFDANNLYGWSMCQLLPEGEYVWVPVSELPPLEEIDENGEYGYIVEANLTYPPELHDAHNDLPYLPESMAPPGSQQTKLLATLYDKTKYVVHLKTLKQALAAGLKLTKIHRVIRFKQSAWLKNYIDLNTKLRAQATSAFAKDFYKLMNNAVYGKTMENKRNHSKVEVVCDVARLEKLIRKPEYAGYTIIKDDFIMVQRRVTQITMDKPLAVGFCILELSKTLMYDFHYITMVPIYGKRLNLLYIDTDSLTYEIFTHDVYEDMQLHQHHFDTSDYPKDHPLYSEVNKKVLGKFKDENNGEIMLGFVGLRSKVYANKRRGGKVTKKAKGSKKYAVAKKITYDDYVECLRSGIVKMVSASNIRSYNHQVYTERQNKVALSANDDKRKILDDGINTRAHGHYLDSA